MFFLGYLLVISQRPWVERTTAPATIVVGNPIATLFALALDPVAATSHSSATIPLVPRKRKAVALDTSVISLERPFTSFLIENVDIGELIEDLMKTKVSPLAYCCIQEFLPKVCVSIFCILHSFYGIQYLFSGNFRRLE